MQEGPKTKGWIKAFVAFHVLAITAWTLPPPPSDSDKVKPDWSSPAGVARTASRTVLDGLLGFNAKYLKTSIFQHYVLSTGFWQYWDMFAPNPVQQDYFGTAIIEYSNGNVALYKYPRIAELGTFERYFFERYRKFHERFHVDDYAYTWPYVAAEIARLTDNRPGTHPVRVRLRRHWLIIPPPGKPIPTDYQEYEYFKYDVKPGDLETKS
ncbi:MAG: hypothetical protein JST35_07295 [Armatimonadetes bacterium]|nr:hypothetical protein [Armatimonadota bacterium]